MGRRSRYIAHRRGFIVGARRFFDDPLPEAYPNCPAEWEGWRYFKLRYLWEKREVITQTFKEYRRVKQTALPHNRPARAFNRRIRRYITRHAAQGVRR